MKPRSPAQKRADQKYRDSKREKKKITVHVTQGELDKVNDARGHISMNAYCRSLILPQKG